MAIGFHLWHSRITWVMVAWACLWRILSQFEVGRPAHGWWDHSLSMGIHCWWDHSLCKGIRTVKMAKVSWAQAHSVITLGFFTADAMSQAPACDFLQWQTATLEVSWNKLLSPWVDHKMVLYHSSRREAKITHFLVLEMVRKVKQETPLNQGEFPIKNLECLGFR